MKTERNILIAFLLNILFSGIEFIGGILTNSVAILSDSVHDLGDALSIGCSYFLERKSKNKPDNTYTYGYARYSVLGSVITTTILTVSSILVIVGATKRMFNPLEVNYDGMILFALIGVILNFIAAYITREGDSLNQKSVNLHMLEDVLGWIVVLIGAIFMRFTDIRLLDPIMSIAVAVFILVNSIKNLKNILDVFLEKAPKNIDIDKLKEGLIKIKGVDDVHHVHVWSIDGFNNYATMHIVTKSKKVKEIKQEIREYLEECHICHSILELEDEVCNDTECNVEFNSTHHHHHH